MQKIREQFPLMKTKIDGDHKKFNLSDPQDRQAYFQHKAGHEIERLNKYFSDGNTFIAYLLGKKNSGKGTYTKIMLEIFGPEHIAHVSVGDIVRGAYKDLNDEAKKKEIQEYLNQHYRGYISGDEAMDSLLGRSTTKLLPTEFILTLIKRQIDKLSKKVLFIDGFPRDLDQVSYSLYFRDLINYRDDLDIFVGIDIPETIIKERFDTRVICPICNAPRSPKLFATKEAGYDSEKDEFYLKCDNPECNQKRMIRKEGDDLGIEAVRDRLELDGKLIKKVFELHGIPKILLHNAIPVNFAHENVDDYEITPEYGYEYDESNDCVKILEKPWQLKDDDGKNIYSLLPAAVVLSLIRQLVKILGI
ncbi:MAG: nucleoside monophosphate kinase [Patescibacteria group bacterium]